MYVVIGIVLVVVAIALAVWSAVFRRPRQDPGIAGFRRHIDALSPESRRAVQDRVRDRHERDAERNDLQDRHDREQD
ncbi:MAG: periplasmic heavy metal sensor [Ilumatobacteraceae bacterium]